MDELSLQKVPYFFMVDFLAQNVEIFKENEIEKLGLLIDFQNFSSLKKQYELPEKVVWKSFPETLQCFKHGFD
ncbi:MAG: hypothetical protein AB7E26_06900 [Chryseobacterium sp.]